MARKKKAEPVDRRELHEFAWWYEDPKGITVALAPEDHAQLPKDVPVVRVWKRGRPSLAA